MDHQVFNMARTHEVMNRVEQTFSMSKGDDVNSYSKNSNVQKSLIDTVVMPSLDRALQKVTLPPAPEPVVVADLGCSSGPNCIRNIAYIVNKLRAGLSDPRGFQAFFNDLPSNDFNTMFQFLSSEINGEFFAAGVPGSFYGRLFLDVSVHIFFSSFCLHYLSKVPDTIYDETSPAYNGNNLHIDGAHPAVGKAYKKQAATDLSDFLHARAAELAPGGLLFLVCSGRTSSGPGEGYEKHFVKNDAFHAGAISMLTTWKELQSRGLLTKEQTAICNLRSYCRTLEELKEGIDRCSSEFLVQTVEMVEGKPFADKYHGDSVAFCATVSGVYRGTLGGYLESIIGKETEKIFWDTFVRVIERDCLSQLLGNTCIQVIALTRK